MIHGTSICLLYGFAVALGGLQPFLVPSSTFDVRRSASAPCGLNVIYGAYPAHVRRDSHESRRQQARRYGGSREAVRCGSGGAPMWIAQDSVSTPLTMLTFWLWAALSAPCVDGAAPAQARRVPHVDCANY